MKKRSYRFRKVAAYILAAAMTLTMSITGWAEEYKADSEETTAVDSLDDAVDVSAEINGEVITTDDSGWQCENHDDSTADVLFGRENGYVKSTVSTKKNTYRTGQGGGVTSWYADGVDIKYSGTLSSGSLMIVPGEEERNGNRYPNHIIASDNKIVISVSRGAESSSGKAQINKKDDDGEEQIHGAYVEVYCALRSTRNGEDKGRIDESCISFDLHDGLEIEKPNSNDKYKTIDGIKYRVWRIKKSGLDLNQPSASVNVAVGDYTVTYYSQIPSVKGGKVDGYVGKITVSNNKTGRVFQAKKVKLVRLKNAETNQGPYPTVSNAGLQITKLWLNGGGGWLHIPSDKEGKRVQKEIKKLTKVDKKASYDKLAIPVIIYPRRLTKEISELNGKVQKDGSIKLKKIATLKGKAGKYSLEFYGNRKKMTCKNGKKDSFKTGIHQVDYDRNTGIISANSADVWTGPDGLPIECVYDKSK